MNKPRRPTLTEIEGVRALIVPHIRRTPLIELALGLPDRRIFLKLETLQPIGAFKLRAALAALLGRDRAELARGVAVPSSGNMAYGVAWAARRLGVPMAAYMVADAPRTKIEGVRKLGGEVRFVTPQTWWDYVVCATAPDAPELLINPVTDALVLAGNGTIGLEIVEDLPNPDWVLTPFGGGGLTSGVAAAVKARSPRTRVLAIEGEHATPATAALQAGKAVTVPTTDSFVKSMGGPSVVPQLWPVVRGLIDGTSVVTLAQIVQAMQLLFAEAKVVAEGAGAAALAAALHDPRTTGNVVCVVSGGNIDPATYIHALQGQTPPP